MGAGCHSAAERPAPEGQAPAGAYPSERSGWDNANTAFKVYSDAAGETLVSQDAYTIQKNGSSLQIAKIAQA